MAQATACIQFLKRDDLYKSEKPYTIQYEPHGSIPKSNFVREAVENIPVQDIRPEIDKLSLEKDGFIVRDLHTEMNYEDYADPVAVQEKYLPVVKALVADALGTGNVAVLEYLIRRRQPELDDAGKELDSAQPVPNAHIDWSPGAIRELAVDRHGEERAAEIMQYPYKVVNVWKPLFGPLLDWPLTFCRSSSITADDLDLMDAVFPNIVLESIMVHHNKAQEWCYLDNQLETEAIILMGGDSELGISGGIPHCAFKLDHKGEMVRPRESIEVRAWAFYANEKLDLERSQPSRMRGPSSAYKIGKSRP